MLNIKVVTISGIMYSRIKVILEEKNISQKQLANMTGITESSISHYVNGDRVPRGANLVKIAEALETTADDLLSENTSANKENELTFAKSLIARNASKMTNEEKLEFISLLMNEGENK